MVWEVGLPSQPWSRDYACTKGKACWSWHVGRFVDWPWSQYPTFRVYFARCYH